MRNLQRHAPNCLLALVRLLLPLFIPTLAALNAQASIPDPENISARILTLVHVHQAQLTPLVPTATIRTCPRCLPRNAPASLTISTKGAGLRLSGSKTATKDLFLTGRYQLRVPQQPPLTFAGELHITSLHGEFLLRLTLPVERYLVAVLNGETAPDESLESLKAMAIVARTYAFENLTRHAAEGFNVCDDTHCQVMRLTPARTLVEQAVSETAGETLWYGGTRAHVYFHQHCGGMTADAHDVFPGEQVPYLRAHPDIYCVRHSSAEWTSEVHAEDIARALTAGGIQANAADGSLAVLRRTPAGRVAALSIGRQEIAANAFRLAVNRLLGWNTIKSDWYELASTGSTYIFHGRGSGHGVGLCQIGAAEMAREGQDARSILAYYFPGTRIGISAHDSGWTTLAAPGFDLLTVNPGDAQRVAPLADAALARARALLPPLPGATPPHPTLRVFPTVELYRESTGQPGWTAANTQGTSISLEPYALLEQKHLLAGTLLHEFLHAAINAETGAESQSKPPIPLWLREGLVEALAQPACREANARHAWPLARIEAELRAPASQPSSTEAHAQAAAQVRLYLKRYGLPPVRRWLRAGVPASVTERSADAHARHPHGNQPR